MTEGELVVRRSTWEPVMGTALRLEIVAVTDGVAAEAETLVVDAARTWEASLSRFRTGSDLDRWRTGVDAEPSASLAPLLARADWWHHRSARAFSAFTGAMSDRWSSAVADGEAPSSGECAFLAADVAVARFRARPCSPWSLPGDEVTIDRIGDCSVVDLHGLAKGWVVDRLAEAASGIPGVARVVVDAGGDLVHRGIGGVLVGVEDPRRARDDAPPIERIPISDAAVATSGNARRWFDVGGRRRSRVIDPRTACPVEHSSSATVVAADAATADVLATICSVLAPEEACRLVDALEADDVVASCLVLAADGTRHRSAGWAGEPVD